jgi:hypothetical protein
MESISTTFVHRWDNVLVPELWNLEERFKYFSFREMLLAGLVHHEHRASFDIQKLPVSFILRLVKALSTIVANIREVLKA